MQCKLVLGYSGDWPPYILKSNNGEVSGADFDILKSVISKMECELTTVKVPINRLLMELEKGTIDVATGASKTRKREKSFHYSQPYRIEVIRLMYDKEHVNLDRFSNLQQVLDDGNLVVLNKSAWYGREIAKLKENKQKYNLVHVDKLSTRLKLFSNQRADGFIADEVVSCSSFPANYRSKIAFHPYVINRNDVYFIFSKKTTISVFVERFNFYLQQLQNSNVITDIYRKHIPHDCFEMLSLSQNKH